MTTAGIAPLLASCLGAVVMLRQSWSRTADKHWWRAGGWGLMALTLGWSVWMFGEGRGVFAALTLVPVAALAVIARGATLAPARRKAGRAARSSAAPEPAERPAGLWRGVLRWSLAGPFGLVAALAIGVNYAVWAPGAIQTRLLIGGLLVPVAWGAAMTWTLADDRIVRAAAVLIGTALLGFGAAMLRGLA